jgi:hypothetical protein
VRGFSSILDPFRFVLISIAGWMNQHQLQIIDYLRDENRVLREQLGGRRVRCNDNQGRRLAARVKGLDRSMLAEVATLVTPETLLVWHRKLIAQNYDGSSKRGPGRPCTAGEIEALVLGRADENRYWGCRRIQGALSNWGHNIARSMIAEVLQRQGMEPAPKRSRKTTWKEFLPPLGVDFRRFLHCRGVDPTRYSGSRFCFSSSFRHERSSWVGSRFPRTDCG